MSVTQGCPLTGVRLYIIAVVLSSSRDSGRKELEQARQQGEEGRSQWAQRELQLQGEKEDLDQQIGKLGGQLASSQQEIDQV